MTGIRDYLAARADRCEHGYAQVQHPIFCPCPGASVGGGDEWSIFVAALRAAVRSDGTVHQSDVRPHIRGRIEPKHIGQLWRRARSSGLVRDTGEREPSDDVAGRNADKLDRIYALRAAA
jgi:hypothetical protein